MKIKFIFPLIVLSFLLSGCTNDALPVIVNQKFVVDNTNLMKPFSYEIKAGDITKFPSSYRLKTFLFIYDEKGDLVQKQNLKSTKYEKVEFALPTKTGKYTLVSIAQFSKTATPATETDGQWKIELEEKLSWLSLSCLGGTRLSGLTGVLGVDVREIDTSKNLEESELVVEMKPVTALLLYRVKDVHTFGDQGAYCLAINREEFDFNISSWHFEAKNLDSPSKYICEIKPSDFQASIANIYGYYSLLPVGKTAFRFDHCTSSSNTPLTNVFYLTPKSAEEYLIELDLDDTKQNHEITWSTELVNGTSKASIDLETMSSENGEANQETISVIDLWNSINEK